MLKERRDVVNLRDSGVYICSPYAAELETNNPELRFHYNPGLFDRDEVRRAAMAFVRSFNIAVIEVVQTKRDIAESKHSSTSVYFTIKGRRVI